VRIAADRHAWVLPVTAEMESLKGTWADGQREGGEGLGVRKCYSATTRIKPSDFADRGATRVLQECYRVLRSVAGKSGKPSENTAAAEPQAKRLG
jgi:hypothetical protein